MQQYLQNKEGLVENVFNKVYDKYDLMNDFMSFGIHRIWKKNLLTWMNPSSNKVLADVASGTGDIGKLFLDFTNKNNEKGFLMRGHLGQYVIVFPKSDLIIVRLGHKKGPKNEGYFIDEAFKMISDVKEH